jgi:hypothetical protein
VARPWSEAEVSVTPSPMRNRASVKIKKIPSRRELLLSLNDSLHPKNYYRKGGVGCNEGIYWSVFSISKYLFKRSATSRISRHTKKEEMSDLTDDPSSDTIPLQPRSDIRKVGGVVIPSKTWVPFVAGAIGGMSGAVLTAPLDVVKTRLQSDFYKERLQAAAAAAASKKGSTEPAVRFGAWRHLVETTVIIRYLAKS